jgi:uncharacterized protein YlxP (DUF503 family)
LIMPPGVIHAAGGEVGVMIVGVAVIEIHVHDSQSLKAKRGVVRSITGRLRNRFNVSVGEVGGQGTWQRAAIGLSMTGSDEATLRKALKKTVDAVEEMHLAQVLVSEIEMIRMPLSPDWKEEAGLPEGMGEELPWEKNLGGEDVREPLVGLSLKEDDH